VKELPHKLFDVEHGVVTNKLIPIDHNIYVHHDTLYMYIYIYIKSNYFGYNIKLTGYLNGGKIIIIIITILPHAILSILYRGVVIVTTVLVR